MNIFFSSVGSVSKPKELGNFLPVEQGGIAQLLNIGLQALVAGAGIYALFNFIMAGYGFLSGADDPKKIQAAWAKIWQSVLGLTVSAGAIVLATIFGYLIYGDATYILNPTIPVPTI